MEPSEDHEEKDSTRTNNADDTGASTVGSSVEANSTRVSVDVDALTNPEKADLVKWEADKYIDNFKFFLELGVKGVGLFYAITGGVLSIHFTRGTNTDNPILTVFLLVPAIVSIGLGIIFFIGVRAWRKTADKLKDISQGFKMGGIPSLFFVTWLIRILGGLFLITGAALVWFFCSVSGYC